MSATIDSPMLWRKANGGDRMAQLSTNATTGLFRSVSSQNGLQTTASKLTSGLETAPVGAIDGWSEFWPSSQSDRRQGSPAATATGCRVELTTGSGMVNVNGQTMREQIDGGGGGSSSSRRRIASQFNKICMRFNSSALPSCLRPSAASGKMLSNSIEGLCTVGTEIRIEVPLRCAVEKPSTTSARLQSPPIVVEKQRSAPEEACCTVDSASSSAAAGVPEVAAGVPDVVSVDVSGVPVALVATILDDDMAMSGLTPEAGGDQFLVLDCRTFVAYNAMHVRDALNVSCSDCISRKRLLTGRTTIGDLVSGGVDGDAKDRYRRVVDAAREVGGVKGGPAQAIVYDEDTSDFRELPPNSPVRLVVSCLLKDGFAVYYMIGGLKAFRKDYGHLCSHSGLPLTRPSVSSGGCPSPSSDGHVDNAKISMILPHLFIGNEHDAADRALLDQLGIGHVINVTSHVPLHFESKGIRYIRFPAADNGVQNLRQYFEDAIRFIDDVQKRGERAMVHCQAGVSRSSTIAIAYVMARSNLNMLDAFRFVKSRRPIVAPNFNFMGQLLDFENALARAQPPDVARVPLPAVVGFVAECQKGRRTSREESCCMTATVE